MSRRLRAGTAAVRAAPEPTNTTILYVEHLDEATAEAAWYARQIAGSDYHPVYVPDDRRTRDPRGHWWDFSGGGTPIETIERRDGVADAVLDYVWALPRGDSAFTTVVVPEVFERPSLSTAIARRRSTFSLKLRLLSEPGVVVTDVPVVLDAEHARPQPERAIARVLVSGVQAASLRSIKYTQTLGLDDARAVFFAFDADEAKRIRSDWEREEIDLPLDIAEAPYRDLGDPLQRYLRELTTDPDVVVSVVMPELIFSGWPRLLHNQRALYIKRLLLFEPQVLLSSVPYHVR